MSPPREVETEDEARQRLLRGAWFRLSRVTPLAQVAIAAASEHPEGSEARRVLVSLARASVTTSAANPPLNLDDELAALVEELGR